MSLYLSYIFLYVSFNLSLFVSFCLSYIFLLISFSLPLFYLSLCLFKSLSLCLAFSLSLSLSLPVLFFLLLSASLFCLVSVSLFLSLLISFSLSVALRELAWPIKSNLKANKMWSNDQSKNDENKAQQIPLTNFLYPTLE